MNKFVAPPGFYKWSADDQADYYAAQADLWRATAHYDKPNHELVGKLVHIHPSSYDEQPCDMVDGEPEPCDSWFPSLCIAKVARVYACEDGWYAVLTTIRGAQYCGPELDINYDNYEVLN